MAPLAEPTDPNSQPYVTVETPRSSQEQTAVETQKLQDASEKSTEPKGQVRLMELFSFADSTDKLLMVLGSTGALAAGVLRPLLVVLFGNVINSFGSTDSASIPHDITSKVNRVALNFTIVGVVGFFMSFLQVYCWSVTASRQSKRIRSLYVNAIITQEIGWFDLNDPMQLSSRVTDATIAIQDGMGAKMSDLLHFSSTLVSGIVIAMVKGWELTLILMAVVPFVAASGIFARKVIMSSTKRGLQSYAQAGAVAQESLSNIRTVHMLNSVDHFVEKYGQELEGATAAGIEKAFAVGWGSGLMYSTIFFMYALGFFLGAVFIAHDNLDGNTCSGSSCYDGGRVLTIFFAVMQGSMALGQAGPSLQAVYSACAAAFDVFELIKRSSLIEPTNDDQGKKLQHVAGNIDIDHVRFVYPSRPEIEVCRGYSLQIKAGETVALVGPSGSGKSTVISLLERFYDPLEGSVKIDGEDVRSLNVKWLRQQIGLVGQEPALFATSIMENIRHGRPSASNSDVIEAAKMANAFHFIMEFPEGFATEVGERGAQLSGGQKQRIAIARAIIKNPPILLLDEATSALDTESERIVQASLDELVAGSNRTTIIVAHRLSTIRGADRIAVHSDGGIVEIGSHDELVQIPNGHYRLLLEAQMKSMVEENAGTNNAVTLTTQPEASSSELPAGDQGCDGLERSMEMSRKSSLHDWGATNANGETDKIASTARIWKMGSPEWKFMVLGGVASIFKAGVYPVAGMLIAKIIHLYYELQKTKHELLHDMRYYSLAFCGLAVVCGTSFLLMEYGFGVASSRLVGRVRLITYRAMLRQEVGWFDLKENSSGALISRLASDSAILQAMTSDFLNRSLASGATMVIVLAISFYYTWQMTLIMFAMAPLLVGSNYVRLQQYISFLSVSNDQDKKLGIAGGLSFGLSQCVLFWVLAFIFYIGGIWVSDGTIGFEDLFIVLMVFMMGSFSVSLASQGSVDSNKAEHAAANVFKIIDRVPEIDATATSGIVLSSIQGNISFKQVAFAYPSRPNSTIYQEYNLTVHQGQTVALVGASGSGKSTAIALLERFYNPTSGMVTLDGHDVRSLSLPWLRDRISLVSQEPVLFAGTIAENIALGKQGASREEIVEAARNANAFDFISNFPQGFDTEVGDRGAQLSGGQKQRIAIATAILRDPDVLLLDEATSALDNESECVVQASLDALMAQKRRTTIVVAHRLSTIRKADVIAVTHDGAIVELGSHVELMRVSGGRYQGMVTQQIAE
ncbi:hypothetical protein BBO99_00008158 [Phytophthora kernoviae]|uniref:Bile salt export pump n=1 Tax=Phytophthora kernoviae TaxID=325452 RepID=A0A3R7JVX7_9STRA|nr:hypothetical protein JM16_002386 [Phytophthora kernoviae]RLN46872.1 hypothetical protein BBI17_008088 [Phytophthora kernoviae]RLN75665.1 hypothetical protein BBO99_00008158 [Phytophthora kernoviae]